MRFAERTNFEEGSSAYGEALRRARAQTNFVDLTVSNPTRCGFDYSAIALNALSTPSSLRYDADSLGMVAAREAVAGLYGKVDLSRVLLTASTSEAYGFLLRLFCEPGDAVLVPSPSYPLLDLLARLHDVELQTYPLVYHDGWQIDPAALEAAITPRTRAIVVIHPNNPTGQYCSETDRSVLFATAQRHGLPLLVDEVFLDYGVEGSATSFAAAETPVPTFVMAGLSKLLALPQMKLAWAIACGPQEPVADAMQRLEVIADTFLSVATPVQAALPLWLSERRAMQGQVLARVQGNLAVLDEMLPGSLCSRFKVQGGWSAVLRVPAVEDDEELAVRLLQERCVAVHPGSFYGFAAKGWLVLSLLVDSGIFRSGLRRLLLAF